MSAQVLERTPDTASGTVSGTALRAVLCGSFRRDVTGLRDAFAALTARFTVLSPAALDFIDPEAEFVRLPHEADDSPGHVEGRHLDAITQADFVWLHAPDGYIGCSAALELGHARALGIPVFAASPPIEQAFQDFVAVVGSPEDVPPVLVPRPGNGLSALQNYYARAARRRGWDGESAQDTLLLLTEELGELVREVRRFTGPQRDGTHGAVAVGHEMADVQLYLVHLANVMGIDLAEATTDKERLNAERFEHRRDVA